MKKNKSLQLKLLQHYFSIQNNIATLKLVYDTFAELINPNFGDDKIEKLNEKLFLDIKEAVTLLPKKYKLNLQIIIKDLGDYTIKECEEIVKQNIYLVVYETIKSNQKKMVGGWSLIGVGAAILLVSYLLHNYNLWFDLINISGTLFVWEGVNMAFLERNHENKENISLAKAIQQITIKNANE